MRHLRPLSPATLPRSARSLLEWQQKALVIGGFADAAGAWLEVIGALLGVVRRD
jgi:hypothetical protein